jgi:hypothetical protein
MVSDDEALVVPSVGGEVDELRLDTASLRA